VLTWSDAAGRRRQRTGKARTLAEARRRFLEPRMALEGGELTPIRVTAGDWLRRRLEEGIRPQSALRCDEATRGSSGPGRSLPLAPTLDNYFAVLRDGRIPIWFFNSVTITAASLIVATAVATIAAFAITRLRFRGRIILLRLMIALMVVPPAVLILPLFLGLQPLGLVNTYQGVVLIYSGLLIPISVYMLTSFFRTLPGELFEAARIDGASLWQILVRIVLPLSAPGFVTLVVVNALWVWNELLIALVFLQDDQKRTLMAGLTLFKGHYSINEPLVMAGTFLSVLPMLLLFLFGQRFFVRGLVAGAVK
jgi:ABC-type glycerol-3-phosphate transport system permease component